MGVPKNPKGIEDFSHGWEPFHNPHLFLAQDNEENRDESSIDSGLTALSLMAAGHALAQAATMDLSPEKRTTIELYVVKEGVAPVTVNERITVGTTLPADVELRTVPTAWGPSVSSYRYVYADNRVYFVEPSSRRVVHVIN